MMSYLSGFILSIFHLGEEYIKERQMLEHLKERLTHGYFNLAVLGQFKRRKSTFLNALLGEEVLPTSVVPLTALPIFIRYHSSPSVKIRFEGNSEEIKYPSNYLKASNILNDVIMRIRLAFFRICFSEVPKVYLSLNKLDMEFFANGGSSLVERIELNFVIFWIEQAIKICTARFHAPRHF